MSLQPEFIAVPATVLIETIQFLMQKHPMAVVERLVNALRQCKPITELTVTEDEEPEAE